MRKQKQLKPSRLVRNSAPTFSLQGVLTQNRAKLVRNDKMEGRDFVVVPMVMMVTGVHNGSGGALYYPEDELAKTPTVWNHKPVVVYHPTINGQGVSACDPKIINSHKIGVIMNTKFDKLGRLTAEAWIEPERANAVDTRVMKAINNGQMMEVSTGLFTENEEKAGEYDGEKYSAIARNYKPDHLAVLPDQKGACSIQDGAGLMRNAASQDPEFAKLTEGLSDDYLASQMRRVLVGNADVKSFNQISNELDRALRKNGNGKSTPMDLWVLDVFPDNTFVFQKEGKLYRQGYSINGNAPAVITGEPVEVVRVTEYKEVTKSPTNNSQPTKTTMNKDQKIAALIGNAKSGFTAESKSYLEGCSEAQLDVFIANSAEKKPEPTAPAAPVANTQAPAAPVATAPVLNKDDQEALNYGKQQLATNKARLVGTITANKANKFTPEQLNAMDINQLENLAALASSAAPAAPQHNYGGLAPVANTAQPAGGSAAETPLEVPTMNFEAPTKK